MGLYSSKRQRPGSIRMTASTLTLLGLSVLMAIALLPGSHGSEFALHNPAEPVPIDPAVLTYISEHLTSPECYELVNFLITTQAEDPDKARQKFVSEAGDDPNNYPCHRALTFWNEEFLEARLSNPSEEKTEIGEALLELAMRYIQRRDMGDSIKKARNDRIQAQAASLTKELRRQREEGFTDEKKSLGAESGAGGDSEGLHSYLILPDNAGGEADTADEDEKERLHGLAFIVTGVVGAIVFTLMCFVFVVRFCQEKRRRKAYAYLDNAYGRNQESQRLYDDTDENEWTL